MTFIYVALGGAIGAVMRYIFGFYIVFPLATLSVNILGSFFMGVAFIILGHGGRASFFLMAGLLGGFTTFSTFSLDVLRLLEEGKAGMASLYVGASVLFSLFAVMCGVWLGRNIS